MLPSELTNNYYLTAAEADAQGRMPVWLLVSRVIEVATNHANILGIGYDALIRHGIAWVLTRLSIEMTSYPRINEHYSFTTWIESYNRLYSDRCFLITDGDGAPIGHARSMWVAIDVKTRSAADLTQLNTEGLIISERLCPVKRIGKQRPLPVQAPTVDYTVQFCDIDLNRHVNTVQYVRHILNQWPMDVYDHNMISRFDIQFHNECHYGDTLQIRHLDTDDHRALCEIIDPEGRHAVAATLTFSPTENCP